MNTDKSFPTHYDPEPVEKRWSQIWEEKQLFRGKGDGNRPVFSIVIPPPNITSHLHLGHALNATLQDILVRWKKMSGFDVCWVPGTDHAGIATQNVVERSLKKENLTRHKLGREKFLKRVWEWRDLYGKTITNQLRRLGCACDWSRERFTLDQGLSDAVTEQFVRLYEEGLIYKDFYIVNWCPRCGTALSDIEVEHKEIDGALYHIHYPQAQDGSPDPAQWDKYLAWLSDHSKDEGLVVATTRPETLLGDSAVAVHPDDPRYKGWKGKSVHLPLTGRNIPVIQDKYVDMEFGTGSLKVTPAHDPNDFQLGKKHGLELLNVLTPQAKINERGGPYEGLRREDARKKIVEDLRAAGLLIKTEALNHSVGHCSRCQTVVEPYFSKQWFVRMEDMGRQALNAVKDGRIKIHPEGWVKLYENWLENIRDWCISRQLWWGHRIPAYTCQSCEKIVVARKSPDKCPQCNGDMLQDEDVLDTWFSSNLWPFSVFGWPEKTKDLEKFYPTSVLVTGWDIIFFWIARMVMAGLKFMDEVPFRDVYINSLIGDEHGKKMSKSSGTAVDPLKVIDQYGTDSLRFALVASETRSHYVPFSQDRVRGYRNFVNKIWNAARFAIPHMETQAIAGPLPKTLECWDYWILDKLQASVKDTQMALESYRFNEAALGLADFFWHQFCDVYLEAIKPRIQAQDPGRVNSAQSILRYVMETSLGLMHPLIPFITEEVYSRLPGSSGCLAEKKWPSAADVSKMYSPDKTLVGVADFAIAIGQKIRSLRAEAKCHPKARTDVRIVHANNMLVPRAIDRPEVQEFLHWATRGGEVSSDSGAQEGDTNSDDGLWGCGVVLTVVEEAP